MNIASKRNTKKSSAKVIKLAMNAEKHDNSNYQWNYAAQKHMNKVVII